MGVKTSGLQALVSGPAPAPDSVPLCVRLDDCMVEGQRNTTYVQDMYNTCAYLFSLLTALQHQCFSPALGTQKSLLRAAARHDFYQCQGEEKLVG